MCIRDRLSNGLPALPLVPVSSSQAVIGAIIGIGLAKGGRSISWSILGHIALGWIFTPIMAALLCFISLFFLENVFNLVVYLRDNGSLKKAVAAENVKYLPVFVLLIGCNASKNFAMFYAFNPSYVAALMYIYILWIALFNLLKARLTPNVPYNRMNVKAALLLLTSVIVLILASG